MPPRKSKGAVTQAQVQALLKEIGSRPLTPRIEAERAASAAKSVRKQNNDYNASTKDVRAAIKSRERDTDARAKVAAKAGMASYVKEYGKPGTAKAEQVKKAQADPRRKKLSDDAQDRLNQAEKANIESKRDPGWTGGRFTKVLNVLLSPSRATAEAANQNQETYYRSRSKGDSVLKSLGKGIKEGADDFLPNIKKKKVRTTFSDVIQSTADNRKAISQGKDPALTMKGDYKFTGAGRVAKAVGGFTLDVLADPTTYVGVGLVTKPLGIGGKVVKSKAAAELLESTAKIVTKQSTIKGTKATPTDLLEVGKVMAVANSPIKAIKKKEIKALTPEARVLYEFAKVEQKATKFKIKGAESTAIISKVQPEFARIAQETVSAARTAEVSKIMADRAAKGLNALSPVVRLDGLADETLRNTVQKALDDELLNAPGLVKLNVAVPGAARFLDNKGNDLGHALSNPNGDLVFKAEWGDPAWVQKQFDELPEGWASVPLKDPQDFVKYVVQHEIGHHLSYKLPKAIANALYASAKEISGGAAISGRAGANAREALAESYAQYRRLGNKATPAAQMIGKRLEEVGKVVDEGTETAAGVAKAVSKQADEAMKAAGLSADDLAEEMAVQTLRNLNPETVRRIQIRAGKATLTLPPLGIAAAARKVGEQAHVKKTIEGFHSKLNANYGILPGLTRLRNIAAGTGTSQIRAEATQLKSVFDAMKKPERLAMMKAWRQGVTTGSYKAGTDLQFNTPVDDALAWFDNAISSVEKSITPPNGAGNGIVAFDQFMSFLPENMRFDSRVLTDRPGWLADAIRKSEKMGDDPAQVLFLMKGAVAHSAAKVAMWDSFGAEFGVPIAREGLDNAQAALVGKTSKALQGKGYRAAVDVNGKPISHLQGKLFHPEVASSITRLDAMFKDPKSTGDIIKQYDKALMAWKGLVTRYNPSFHTRTLLGEFMLGYLGGMNHMVWSYNRAALVMRGRNAELLGEAASNAGAAGAKGMSGTQINAANLLSLGPGAKQAAKESGSSAVVVRHKKYGNLSSDFLWHAYQQSGLKSGFASADLVRDVGPLRTHVGGKINDVMQTGTEFVEDFGRMAHFLDVIRSSSARTVDEAIAEAAEVVTKMHLDYTAVTGFEKSGLTRVMPFYKWLRLSTPLMVEHLLHNPGKALVIPKTMMMASEIAGYDIDDFGAFPGGPDAVVPDWLRNAGAVPIGNINGNTNYYDPTALFPLASSVGASDPSKSFGMLSPALRMAGELGLNKTAMGAPPFDDIKSYLLRQLPQTNFGNNMVTGGTDPDIDRKQRVAQFLVNPGIQPNTPNRMRSEAFRMREEALAIRDKDKPKPKKDGSK